MCNIHEWQIISLFSGSIQEAYRKILEGSDDGV
jgi:hypothetical protein